MVVEEVGEVVWDEVLAGDAQVDRVPALELGPHPLQGGGGDVAQGGGLGRQAEHVVPDGGRHLLRSVTRHSLHSACRCSDLHTQQL